MADNLVGRGDVQDAHINFRPSAGDVNITDGAARIERIKGNSLVWNQGIESLINKRYGNVIVKNGVTFEKISDESYHISGGNNTTSYAFSNDSGNLSVQANHYYLFDIVGCDKSYINLCLLNIGFSLNGRISEIKQSKIDGNAILRLTVASNTPEINEYVSCQVIDLTQMFGAGNEPTTVAEYRQRKPMNIEDEYAYNAGTFVDMKADSLISTSDNAYDYVEGYARVMGGHTYDCTYGTAFVEKVYFSTDKDNIVAEENAMTSENGEYTFPSDGYAVPYTTDGDVREYCVCLQHSYDKPHPPYQQDVKDLSFIGEAFPDGMRSAGSAFDEIRFNKTTKKWEAVKRIGEVDLGSLNIAYTPITDSRPYGLFFVDIADMKSSSPLRTNRYVGNGAPRIDKSIWASNQRIYIVDSSYSDATTFKQAMQEQGVNLYYELAEPIVEDIDLSPNFNPDYLAWDFGMEEAIASVPSAPFRADIQYGDNFVDDIRKNKEDIATNKANIAKNTSAINSKQDTLTLTTKPNGNIVIGNLAGQTKEFMPATPSGDPMHYAYEEVGATWNADTGYWSMLDMTDITNEEMRAAISRGSYDISSQMPFAVAQTNIQPPRFTLPRNGIYNATMVHGLYFFAYNNTVIEVVHIDNSRGFDPYQTLGANTTMSNAFYGCTNLRRIGGGVLRIQEVSNTTGAFQNCTSLQEVRMSGLKVNLDLHWSPLIVEHATYLLKNANSTASFTITFKASMQAIYEANADFIAAKSEKTNITILYQ